MRKSTTGYKGVSIDNRNITKKYKSFVEYISPKKKRVYIQIGTYETPELAHIARIKFIDNLK